MKYLTTILSAVLITGFSHYAQAITPQDVTVRIDTVSVSDTAATIANIAAVINKENEIIIDSTLVGKDIFEILWPQDRISGGTVNINQSPAIRQALNTRVKTNSLKEIKGFRVRIYFSNAQNAREMSLAAATRFHSIFPDYAIYRKYVSPNFKVTVGNFRTRSEALVLLNSIRVEFPSAFIVQEQVYLSY